MVYILAAILIFGVLIAVHELGHFMAAKACGVRVNEFSIGMGPTILKKEKGDTTYSLRLFPIGGFCAMEGEEENSDDPAALNNKGFWQKLLIFVAGAAMNFVAGFLIILILNAGAAAFYTPTITGFADGCPLQSEIGLQEGDRIWSIDGERVYVYSALSLLFPRGHGTKFDLVVVRDGAKVKLTDFPMTKAEYPSADGTTYTGYGLYFGTEKATFANRITNSWYNAVDFVRLVRLSLQMLFSGEASFKDMSGPVGIVSTITDVGQQAATVQDAVVNIAYLAALIAVNLAVMNLLPLPALDGGKIFFLVVNTLCMVTIKKKIPEKYENYIHLAGFGLLMLLMVAVTFQDVWKIFQ
ncbi:MAG: peptidase M50 [Clostridiales bacterium]|nr:peptidase M50 [Clostridiales bacterium]